MVSRDLGLVCTQMSHCFRYGTLVQLIGWVTFPRGTQWVTGTNWGTENSSRCLVLKSRSRFLRKSCTRCSGFLSLHLFFDYVAKLAFIQSLVAVIDFIALPSVNPTPTLPTLCSLVAFLPGRAILWFTHSPAKLLRSMNFQCSKDLCVRVFVCVQSPLLTSARSQSYLPLSSSVGES